MRTFIRLNKHLVERARQEASRRGITLTALIEQAIELTLRRPLERSQRSPIILPVSSATGGTHAGVNLDRSPELLERMGQV